MLPHWPCLTQTETEPGNAVSDRSSHFQAVSSQRPGQSRVMNTETLNDCLSSEVSTTWIPHRSCRNDTCKLVTQIFEHENRFFAWSCPQERHSRTSIFIQREMIVLSAMVAFESNCTLHVNTEPTPSVSAVCVMDSNYNLLRNELNATLQYNSTYTCRTRVVFNRG